MALPIMVNSKEKVFNGSRKASGSFGFGIVPNESMTLPNKKTKEGIPRPVIMAKE